VGEHKGAVQGLDRSHGRVQLAQELLNRQKTILGFESQRLGDPFLMIKSEAVILSGRLLVKVISDEMDEFKMAFQVRIFFVRKNPGVLKVLRVRIWRKALRAREDGDSASVRRSPP